MQQDIPDAREDHRSSTPARNKILKAGWVRKRIKYNIVHPFADRFLRLTSTSILYFHSDTDVNDDLKADCKIPLNSIMDISVKGLSSDGITQEILITVDSVSFVTNLSFQCPGTGEGDAWAMQIKKARDQYITELNTESDHSKPAVSWKRHALNKRIVGKVEGFFLKRRRAVPELLSEDQIHLLIKFGNLLVTDRGVMALVVEAVLDALNGKHGKEISLVDLTKKLGQAVAMWLGGDSTDDLRAARDDIQQTEAALLEAWLSVALHRELKRTYLDREEADEKDLGSSAAEGSPTSGGVMKMPFRGDNCESIFLANFMKGVALKSGTLSDLLQPIVRQVAMSPEIYNVQPVLARNISDSAPSPLTASTESPSPTSNEAAGGGKLHVLSADINDISSTLFESVATSYDMLPHSICLLIKKIYEISLEISSPPVGAVESKRHEATIFPEAVDDESERLFCTASCGIIFLRLLCPAIISPLEWGTLRRHRPISNADSISPSPKTANNITSDPPEGTVAPGLSIISNLLEFLAAGADDIESSPSVSVDHKEPAELAWIDQYDEDLRCPGRSAVDVGTSAASLIIIAHVLSACPEALRLLDEQTKDVVCAHTADTRSPSTITEHTPNADMRKHPKRNSDPLFSLSNLKQFVHSRTWSQPPPVGPLHSSDISGESTFIGLVNELTTILPITKAEEMIQLHYTSHASLVDPGTEKIFRSSDVRKSLINVAKNVQRVANASCVPESQLESYIADAAVGGVGGTPGNRDNHNFMLSSAVLMKRMYRSIASATFFMEDVAG